MLFQEQIEVRLNMFKASIEAMAWEVIDQAIEYQRKYRKLIEKLIESGATKRKFNTHMLKHKIGMWDRGHDIYKIIGPGNKVDTYILENLKTGKRIKSKTRTLVTRWKCVA